MITVQIASLPERAGTLKKTVKSLIDQVDMVFVALNNYDEIPPFLANNRKIISILMDNSLGDSAKFYDADQRKGYVLTCDDDIVYPEGYVSYMTRAADRYKGVVTLLGKRYDTRPIKSYRKGYTSIYRALSTVSVDAEVHVGGTGVMAYHTDSFKVDIDMFERKNMADLWIAKAAHEQGVKIMSIAHPRTYLSHKRYPVGIWNTSGNQDAYQTEVINGFLK